MSKSFITPFLVDNLSVNGKIVHLDNVLAEIVEKHNYPDEISKLLAEGLVFVAMVGSSQKFSAIVTLQIESDDSVVNLLVADYVFQEGSKAFIRGYVEFNLEKFDITIDKSFSSLLRNAKMIVTIDLAADSAKRYQGVVETAGKSLSIAATQYLQSSQQIDSVIKIAASKLSGKWKAGGMIVQQLPSDERNEDDWTKVSAFVDTLTDQELFLEGVDSETLLYRLFHEDVVYVYEEFPIEHKCRCSRAKMEKSISLLPENERTSLKTQGIIAIKCQFCGKEEIFE